MITALITLYNPEPNVIDNVWTISSQVDKVYLCDNSKKNNGSWFKEVDNAEYVFNGQNFALSKAFNIILRKMTSNWNENDFVVFFDQDSAIEPGHIAGLVKEYHYLESKGYDVGCIGPIYYNLNTNQLAIPRVKKQISKDNYIVTSIITSSLLCQYKDIKEIGFWNEQLFLDLADWDLCWRLMKNGKVCIKTKAVVLKHTLGFGEKQVGPIRLGKSAAIREYYQTRNSMYLLFKRYTPLKYRIKFIRNLTIRPIFHCLFLDKPRERMKYIVEGYADYFRKEYGEWSQRK